MAATGRAWPFVPTTVDGLYHRSAVFERLLGAVSELIHRSRADQNALLVLPPPVLPREVFERTQHVRFFPDRRLSQHIHRRRPRACRIAARPRRRTELGKPALARRGGARSSGMLFALPSTHRTDAQHGRAIRSPSMASGTSQVSIRPGCSPSACTSSCFVGSPDGARTHRELWLDRATQLLDGLGLTVDVVPPAIRSSAGSDGCSPQVSVTSS